MFSLDTRLLLSSGGGRCSSAPVRNEKLGHDVEDLELRPLILKVFVVTTTSLVALIFVENVA